MRSSFISRKIRSRRDYKMGRFYRRKRFDFRKVDKFGYYPYKKRAFYNNRRRKFSLRFKKKLTNEKLNKEIDDYFKKDDKKGKVEDKMRIEENKDVNKEEEKNKIKSE